MTKSENLLYYSNAYVSLDLDFHRVRSTVHFLGGQGNIEREEKSCAYRSGRQHMVGTGLRPLVFRPLLQPLTLTGISEKYLRIPELKSLSADQFHVIEYRIKIQ